MRLFRRKNLRTNKSTRKTAPSSTHTRFSHCIPRYQACIRYYCPISRLHHSCTAGSVLVGVHIVYKVELLDQLPQPCSCQSRCSCQHGERSCCQGRLAAPGTHPVCQSQGRQHSKCSCSHLQDFRPCQRLFMKTKTFLYVWQCHNEMATRIVRQMEVFLGEEQAALDARHKCSHCLAQRSAMRALQTASFTKAFDWHLSLPGTGH